MSKKNLLIITQKVDEEDGNLGFFIRWIKEFSRYYKIVNVICLQKGKYKLPANVKVHSLGKEKNYSKLKIISRFYKLILNLDYNHIFVHMNQIWTILGGFIWKLKGKKVNLWYTHKSVPFSLKISRFFVDEYFTVQKEGFNLKTKKVKFMGHGIDTQAFSLGKTLTKKEKIIISVSRISKTKNQLIMVKAVESINKVRLEFYGSPITKEDKEYLEEIKKYVKEKKLAGKVLIKGKIEHSKVNEMYKKADLFINLSETGSMDKAVLEAMSCGCRILTSNKAFKNIVNRKNYSKDINHSLVRKKIKSTLQGEKIDYRKFVVQNHNLKKLVKNIVKIIKKNY